MTDSRALVWRHFFPADAGYDVVGGPAWLRDALAGQQAGRERVLVAWGLGPRELPHLDKFTGVVAINAGAVSAASLEAQGFRCVRTFAALPGITHPRWLVPVAAGPVSSAALSIYTPYRLAARLGHRIVKAAIRTRNPLWRRPLVLVASRNEPALERIVGGCFPSQDLHLAVSTGTPGPARKPTIGVIDGTGRVLGFARIGHNSLTRSLVRHEASVLRSLGERSHLQGLVPALLFEGGLDADDDYVTVQTAVEGKASAPAFSAGHSAFLNRLAGGAARPAASAAAATCLASRLRSSSGLRDLAPLVESALSELRPLMTPPTIVHGDFAPWNLRQQGREIAAFDWEYGDLDGLPLIDELHHRWQVGFLLNGWTEERAVVSLQELARSKTDFSARHAEALVVFYLAQGLLRRLDEGHQASEPGTIRYRHVLERLRSAVSGGVTA